MAKNNKKPATKQTPAAPVIEKEAVIEPEVINDNKPVVEVLDVTSFINKVNTMSQEGLDPNHRVELLSGLDRHFMQPNAAEKTGVSPEVVQKINRITAIGWVTTLACEATFGKNPFAVTLSKSQLLEIAEVGKELGINFNTKLLPANTNNEVVIESKDITVSKETKKVLAAEQKIKVAKPSWDPTKIETEEDLKKAILSIMIEQQNALSKIVDSINFYRAYLGVQANKSENKDVELKKLNSKTNIDLLNEIRGLLVDCPFVLNGMGRVMQNFTSINKSPIPAFCMFRNTAKNKQTGIPSISDNEIADYVRVLVEWATDLKIKAEEKKIVSYEENIKTLSTDKKANAKGIEECNSKIEATKKNIEHLKKSIEYVTMPTSDVADNLLKNYTDKDKAAVSIFNFIVGCYYADIDKSTVDASILKQNVQQYAGIITNLFRDATTPILEYNEANIVEIMPITKKEEEVVEEPTEEKEPVKKESVSKK